MFSGLLAVFVFGFVGLLVVYCLLIVLATALYIYAFLMFVSCSVDSGCYVCVCGLGGLLL